MDHEKDATGGVADPEDHPEKKQQPKKKVDPADWWKRGEAPPF